MSAGAPAVLFFCLGTGAALGCLFCLFQAARILLRAGKLLTAALDVLFCCLCAVSVFLCALAVDHGRLRLVQVLLQALGAWSAVAALGPLMSGAAERVRKIFGRLSALLRKAGGFVAPHFRRRRRAPAKKREKTRKKRQKPKKKT